MSELYRGFIISSCKNIKGYSVFGRTGAVLCILPTLDASLAYIDDLLN